MGNFEKLSVLVIVVIIVMILVVALYTWTGDPEDATVTEGDKPTTSKIEVARGSGEPAAKPDKAGAPDWTKLLEEIGPRTPGTEPPKPVAPVAPKEELPVVPNKEAAPSTPAVAATNWEYPVQSSDTIGGIAERELGSVKRQGEILALNPGVDPRALQIGQVLVMPPRTQAGAANAPSASEGSSTAAGSAAAKPGEWYVVQRGDRLSTLSKRFYKTAERWPDIWARNLSLIRDPDDLPPGARIFLPR